jgi:branched-chain amino acid transport system ATP-binding protein
MLAVSRAIVEPRELLLIDEPSKGLAPAIIQNLIDAFASSSERRDHPAGGAELHFAKRLGDSVAVMDNGRVVHPAAWPNWPPTRRCSSACWDLSLGAFINEHRL